MDSVGLNGHRQQLTFQLPSSRVLLLVQVLRAEDFQDNDGVLSSELRQEGDGSSVETLSIED